MCAAYYRGAMGILLVYNVIDDKSFSNIRVWMRNIEQHANESVVKILLGNQCDNPPDKRVRDADSFRLIASCGCSNHRWCFGRWSPLSRARILRTIMGFSFLRPAQRCTLPAVPLSLSNNSFDCGCAQNNINVEEAFTAIATAIKNKKPPTNAEPTPSNTTNLNDPQPGKKSAGCCG